MQGYIQKADDAADTLKEVYLLSMEELDKEVQKLFKTFQTKHGLTEKEARDLLKKVRSDYELRTLIRELEKNPKNRDLVAELEAQAYSYRIKHLEALERQISTITVAIATSEEARFTSVLTDIANEAYLRSIFNLQQRVGVAWSYRALSEDKVKRILDQPWYGSNYSERIWANREYLAKEVKNEVMTGILTGRPVHKTTRAIQDKMQSCYYNAWRLMRTETAHVANTLHKEAYEDTEVKKYIYVATLDNRTSKICRMLDGKTFKVSEAKTGTNYPPMHPNCRSTTIAWMPEELMQRLTRRAKAVKDGRIQNIEVPATMRYKEWYEKYGRELARYEAN